MRTFKIFNHGTAIILFYNFPSHLVYCSFHSYSTHMGSLGILYAVRRYDCMPFLSSAARVTSLHYIHIAHTITGHTVAYTVRILTTHSWECQNSPPGQNNAGQPQRRKHPHWVHVLLSYRSLECNVKQVPVCQLMVLSVSRSTEFWIIITNLKSGSGTAMYRPWRTPSGKSSINYKLCQLCHWLKFFSFYY